MFSSHPTAASAGVGRVYVKCLLTQASASKSDQILPRIHPPGVSPMELQVGDVVAFSNYCTATPGHKWQFWEVTGYKKVMVGMRLKTDGQQPFPPGNAYEVKPKFGEYLTERKTIPSRRAIHVAKYDPRLAYVNNQSGDPQAAENGEEY